jgi:hypothetical protein
MTVTIKIQWRSENVCDQNEFDLPLCFDFALGATEGGG